MWIIFIASAALIALVTAVIIGITYRIIKVMIPDYKKHEAEFDEKHEEMREHIKRGHEVMQERINKIKENLK